MPLESREDYVRLNEHLWELDQAAREFAESNGYEYGPPLTNGLYPKLRMWRTKNGMSQNICFDMELTGREERFDLFFEGIPYSVGTSSWIDDLVERVRHHLTRVSDEFRFPHFAGLLARYLSIFVLSMRQSLRIWSTLAPRSHLFTDIH